jgi:O-antigen ligase
LTSLAISPTVNFDPINLVKTLIFVSIAFYCIGILIGNPKQNFEEFSRSYRLTIFFFLFFLTLPLFVTSAPIDQQFWGSFGRNTGYLAYLSFLFLTISSSAIKEKNFYRRIVLALVLTTVPMSLYCFIQIAKLDPFNWSTFDIFGTLGNANFLSAFLGMGAIGSLVFSLDKDFSTSKRIFLVLLSVISFGITIRTNSIQGPLIYVAGVGIALFFVVRSSRKFNKLRYLYLLSGFFGFSLAVFALFNKGPLAKIIFQPSVLYRADYMHAGWVMTKSHPLTGIGLDSFGDWYRQSRGLVSTMRTGPERTSNTAHNIFLDISSGGGIFLLVSYLALLSIGLISALKYFKGNSKFDPAFIAIFSIWCAYQIQSAISINQVGVGVWGWLLTGALIGYPKSNGEPRFLSTKLKSRSGSIRKKPMTLNASAGASSLVMLILGFSLAFVPWNADHRYYSAYNSRDLNAMMEAVKVKGSTSWHISQVIEAAMKNNFTAQATEMDNLLLARNPRDYFGWRVRYFLTTSSPEQKAESIVRMKNLDPYNPEIPKS